MKHVPSKVTGSIERSRPVYMYMYQYVDFVDYQTEIIAGQAGLGIM